MVMRSVMEAPHLNIRIFKKHFNSIHLLSNHNIFITVNILQAFPVSSCVLRRILFFAGPMTAEGCVTDGDAATMSSALEQAALL
jgi:hypothetical protein